MGFFSSIGSVLGGGLGFLVGGPAGAVVGGGLGGGIGSGIESNQANKTAQGYYNSQMSFAQQQAQFNQDYVKNAMQWRVEDAKKAGVHPMAALGFSSPSYSAVSAPSAPGYAMGNSIDPLEFGQSLNYAATKGKDKQQQADMVNLQLEGLMLDNEYKRAQIDQLKVDTLASSIASDQALTSPGAPTLHPENQHVPGQSDSGYSSILGKDSYRLFNIAMHGDSALLVLNPDIADSVTESTVNNLIAMGVREVETGNNHQLIDEIISKFPKHVRREIADGNMRLASIPGTGAFRVVPVQPGENFDRYNVYGIEVKK